MFPSPGGGGDTSPPSQGEYSNSSSFPSPGGVGNASLPTFLKDEIPQVSVPVRGWGCIDD